jgi:hypothetical protein
MPHGTGFGVELTPRGEDQKGESHMVKFPATHLIQADRAEFLSISKADTPQISFYSGDTDVHHVVMPRQVFE